MRAFSRSIAHPIHGLSLQQEPYSTAGATRPTQAEASTMRFDLIGERDRFIPGWYGEAHMCERWTIPKWHRSARFRRVLASVANSLPTPLLDRFLQRQRLGGTGVGLVRTVEGSTASP